MVRGKVGMGCDNVLIPRFTTADGTTRMASIYFDNANSF
jgi:hypothetical protein